MSLPPSCAKLFDAVGVSAAIERAGFVRSTGNTVWWGRPDPRVELFASGLGWQVDLARLENILLDAAAGAGVVVERAVADRSNHHAAFVLDCTGRAGVLARGRNLRRHHDGPKTIALAAEWRGAFSDLPDASHTVIESYDDGWMWSVPAAPGIRHVSAMIDPQRSGLARGGSSRDVYLAEIAKTRAFRSLLKDAALTDGPSGWDASTYFADDYAGDGWLLVGDAGSFIDPLSSAGVKKALASAWLAAIVVNTCLRTPSLRREALDFFNGREREIERHHADESRAFLAGAARGHDRPFWAERSADVGAHRDDGESAKRALEWLRQVDELRLQVASEVAFEPRPVVVGNEIRLAPHVVIADSPAVRYVGGVDVICLLELAPRASQVPELFEAYRTATGPAALHDFLMALSTAVARGWLVRQ